MVVCGDRMVVASIVVARADVDGDTIQPGHVVQEPMVGVVRDVVRLNDAQLGIDDDAGLGADAVTNPAQSQVIDAQHARC